MVEHLSKRFGRRVAFDDVSFQVGSGEVFGFLGPNGAGKTTTVRTLGTLLAPTSGSATVAGHRVERRERPGDPGADLGHARVPRPLPPPHGGGEPRVLRQALRAGRRAHGRIERALQAVNLTDRANDLCRALSKGLRQRVALARALLNDPAVLFLDEPTSGLDPVATREVHELIAALKDRGVTIFLTTHRLEEAERLCDRVAILNTTMRLVGPSRRAARPVVQKEPRGPAPGRARRPRLACSPGLPGSRAGRRRPSGSYLLTVPDPDAAAPEVARALVHAGADILSITESRHSLEDVYLRARRRRRGGEAAMSFSWARVGAILQKELRDYRRNRFVVYTMAFLPLIFVIAAPIDPALHHQGLVHAAPSSIRASGFPCSTCLIIPAIMPSVLAAYSVVGEREQGTLEPVLTTPIRREEFLIGKALAVLVPTLAIAYLIFGIFLALSQRSSPSPPSHPQCSSAPTCSSSCSSRRSSPAGRSGPASPSPPARVDVRAAQQLGTFGQPAPARHRGADVVQRDHAAPRVWRSGSPPRCCSSMFSDGGRWRPCSTGNGSSPVRGLDRPNLRTNRTHPGMTREKGEDPVAATLQLVRERNSLWSFDVARSSVLLDGNDVGSIELAPDDRGADRARASHATSQDGSLHQPPTPL